MRTKEIDFPGIGSITLKRPKYTEMRAIGEKVEGLMMADTAPEVIFSDDFAEVLAVACNTPADLELAESLDQNEMWALWNEYIEFCRFEAFFVEATHQHQEKQGPIMERRLAQTKARLDMMKKAGLVRADFSAEGFIDQIGGLSPEAQARLRSGISKQKPQAEAATSKTPSSTTSSPPSTDGDPTK